MSIKSFFGVTKFQKETELKIAFEKLLFLATEMDRGNDRATDVVFWEKELAVIEEWDQGNNFLLTRAKEGYQLLFKVFQKRHKINP